MAHPSHPIKGSGCCFNQQRSSEDVAEHQQNGLVRLQKCARDLYIRQVRGGCYLDVQRLPSIPPMFSFELC